MGQGKRKLILASHAELPAQQRGLSHEGIEDTVNSPDSDEPAKPGRGLLRKRLPSGLRVAVVVAMPERGTQEPVFVVTAGREQGGT